MQIKGLAQCLAHSNLEYIIIVVVTTILMIVNILILVCSARHLLARL